MGFLSNLDIDQWFESAGGFLKAAWEKLVEFLMYDPFDFGLPVWAWSTIGIAAILLITIIAIAASVMILIAIIVTIVSLVKRSKAKKKAALEEKQLAEKSQSEEWENESYDEEPVGEYYEEETEAAVAETEDTKADGVNENEDMEEDMTKKETKPVKKESAKTAVKPAPKTAPAAKHTPAAKPVHTEKPASENKVYHISKRAEDRKWQVKLAGSDKALKLFWTQEEAIEYAKSVAGNQEGRIVIHKEDGSFRKLKY